VTPKGALIEIPFRNFSSQTRIELKSLPKGGECTEANNLSSYRAFSDANNLSSNRNFFLNDLSTKSIKEAGCGDRGVLKRQFFQLWG
jgi:hypothetical protein